MKKILKNNQVLCIILCLLVIANAFVWTQTALNNRRREQLVGLTDRFEQQADEMREKNRRTLTTHLLTMDSFVDEVTPLFEENRIPDGVAAMIAFDGDNFGKKNEEFGESTGNRLALALSEVVKKHFPDSPLNIVTNVGEKSDEFYMFLMGRESEEALIAEIEAFQQDVRGITVKADDKVTDVSLTISIGIAFYHDDISFEALFDTADAAGYEAKEAGKDCYRVAED